MNEVMHLQIKNICAMIVTYGKGIVGKNASIPNDVNFTLKLTFK
jgi:hypothetical protein